jgi:cutinase
VPTLVIGAQNDTVAQVGSHSEPFYNSMSATLDKAYLELRGASHFAPNSANVTIAKYSISWLKRFVDNDTRFEQFLCGAPHQADLAGTAISEYRDTCPYS